MHEKSVKFCIRTSRNAENVRDQLKLRSPMRYVSQAYLMKNMDENFPLPSLYFFVVVEVFVHLHRCRSYVDLGQSSLMQTIKTSVHVKILNHIRN